MDAPTPTPPSVPTPTTYIPTPPASSRAPSVHPNPLPAHRRHPLKPGGPKESELIHYLDHNIGRVQARVQSHEFKTFAEASTELEGVVDVLWVSGSPNLQIPYLLNVALIINESIPLYKPAPKATLRLLEKLDFAFSALLQGRDPDTDAPLPGFENGREVSTTEKVRMKGIVERTRLVVVKKLGTGEGDEEEGEEEDAKGDGDGDVEMEDEDEEDRGMVSFEGFEDNENEGVDGEGDAEDAEEREERSIAKVFEKTLAELGDVLGGEPIGIITDE